MQICRCRFRFATGSAANLDHTTQRSLRQWLAAALRSRSRAQALAAKARYALCALVPCRPGDGCSTPQGKRELRGTRYVATGAEPNASLFDFSHDSAKPAAMASLAAPEAAVADEVVKVQECPATSLRRASNAAAGASAMAAPTPAAASLASEATAAATVMRAAAVVAEGAGPPPVQFASPAITGTFTPAPAPAKPPARALGKVGACSDAGCARAQAWTAPAAGFCDSAGGAGGAAAQGTELYMTAAVHAAALAEVRRLAQLPARSATLLHARDEVHTPLCMCTLATLCVRRWRTVSRCCFVCLCS